MAQPRQTQVTGIAAFTRVRQMDSLVTTSWLDEEIGAPDLRIVDATWFLADDGRDAIAEHEAAHIPDAVFLDLAEIADTGTTPNMLPTPEKFASRMQALGLGDGTRIIIYDDSPHHSAARAWAMLRSFGIDKVAILDGGFAKWRAEGRAVETRRLSAKPRHLTPRDRHLGIVDLTAMKAIVADGVAQIVDARPPARFAGSQPEPRPGVVPGHIPGSLNLPQGQLFAEDGTWKRGAALREAFVAAGVDPDRPMVTTCGSGVTASVIAFGAHLLGKDARIYDGSWAEWGADPSTPKATGPA